MQPVNLNQPGQKKRTESRWEDTSSGWILYDGDDPVGAGPGSHAAIGDGRRRTGWPENSRHKVEPATPEQIQAAADKLGPGGLTAAEAAWCAGTMNTVPTYRRSVDAANGVRAAAERLGGRLDGLTIRFGDGSELQLVPLRPELGHSHLIRLPPEGAPQGTSRR